MLQPVSPGVDIKIGHDHRVQTVGLGGPLQHWLESEASQCDRVTPTCQHVPHSPRHVRRDAHAWEGPDGLVSEVKRIERRPVNDIRDQLIAHEYVLEEVIEDKVGLAESLQ